MGDMADYALEQMMDVDEIQQRHLHTDPMDLDDCTRELLFDYDGSVLPLVFSRPPKPKIINSVPSGPGPCPRCGSPTKLIEGRNGEFYGCSKFPRCKGSRNRTI